MTSGAPRANSLIVGVMGTGHLGTYHLKKYASHPSVTSLVVHDREPGRALEKIQNLSSLHPVKVADQPEECFEVCDAVSVAVPTWAHAGIVEGALEAGCHVLVEKPITASFEEALKLVEMAAEADRVLQVGHVERFNPALQGLEEEEITPRFIEAHRLAPYNPRGTDVGVVLDLMVHELDLILNLVGEEPSDLHAAGVGVITDSVDIANVRLSFPGGCVANVTASRISLSSMRKIRIFQPQAYLSLDLQQGSRELVRMRSTEELLLDGEIPVMQIEGQVITRREFQGEADALAVEIDAFLRAVIAREAGLKPEPPFGVDGEEAAAALNLAERITREIGSG